MRFRKYLLVPWLSIACYALSTLFAGASGIEAYRELLGERDEALANLEDLEAINRELEGTMEALRLDPDTIKIRARELGYGEDSEHFVRIVGLSSVRYQEMTPGTVKTAKKSEFIPDIRLRIASALAGLALFLLFFLSDALELRKTRAAAPFRGELNA